MPRDWGGFHHPWGDRLQQLSPEEERRDRAARERIDEGSPDHFRDWKLVYLLEVAGWDAGGRQRFYAQKDARSHSPGDAAMIRALRMRRRGHRPTLDRLT